MVKLGRWLTVVWVLLGGLGVGLAQKDVEDALKTAVVGKALVVRGFPGERELKFAWVQGKMQQEGQGKTGAGFRMMAVFKASGVKLKNGKSVEFNGVRGVLIRDAAGSLAASGAFEAMKIKVNLTGAIDGADVQALVDGIFYRAGEDAVADVPVEFAGMVPVRMGPRQASGPMIYRNGAWEKLLQGSGLKAPRVLKQLPPEFSQEAQRQKVSAKVVMVFHVNEKGQVQDVWVTTSAGMGLDEKAVEAVLRYVLQPSTYQGVAVGTVLSVETMFDIY